MTEAEWLVCDDPTVMLEFLRGRASDRKLRLFAVACCRRVWHYLPISTKGAVQVAERFIEGEVKGDEFKVNLQTQAAQAPAQERELVLGLTYHEGSFWRPDHIRAVQRLAVECAGLRAATPSKKRQDQQASLLRDVFGPFAGRTSAIPGAGNDAVAVAQAIYADRAFDRLPILGDALEDAGCTSADVLEHCRGPGPHARGCWVVDLVLSKE